LDGGCGGAYFEGNKMMYIEKNFQEFIAQYVKKPERVDPIEMEVMRICFIEGATSVYRLLTEAKSSERFTELMDEILTELEIHDATTRVAN
jgi:hypothetical protein